MSTNLNQRILTFLRSNESIQKFKNLIEINHLLASKAVSGDDFEYIFAKLIQRECPDIKVANGDHTPGVDIKTTNFKNFSAKTNEYFALPDGSIVCDISMHTFNKCVNDNNDIDINKFINTYNTYKKSYENFAFLLRDSTKYYGSVVPSDLSIFSLDSYIIMRRNVEDKMNQYINDIISNKILRKKIREYTESAYNAGELEAEAILYEEENIRGKISRRKESNRANRIVNRMKKDIDKLKNTIKNAKEKNHDEKRGKNDVVGIFISAEFENLSQRQKDLIINLNDDTIQKLMDEIVLDEGFLNSCIKIFDTGKKNRFEVRKNMGWQMWLRFKKSDVDDYEFAETYATITDFQSIDTEKTIALFNLGKNNSAEDINKFQDIIIENNLSIYQITEILSNQFLF